MFPPDPDNKLCKTDKP